MIRLIAIGVLNALEFIHSLNIIHGDVKPENVALTEMGMRLFLPPLNSHTETTRSLREEVTVKLIDYGSCIYYQNVPFKNNSLNEEVININIKDYHNEIEDKLQTSHLSFYLQSRPYRAPELILMSGIDFSIDIWAFGCMICEIWKREVLFQSGNNITLLASIISGLKFNIKNYIDNSLPNNNNNNNLHLINNWKYNEFHISQEIREGENGNSKIEESFIEMNGNLCIRTTAIIRSSRIETIHYVIPRDINLIDYLWNSELTVLDEDRNAFIDFILGCLQVDVRCRISAFELLQNSWIKNTP